MYSKYYEGLLKAFSIRLETTVETLAESETDVGAYIWRLEQKSKKDVTQSPLSPMMNSVPFTTKRMANKQRAAGLTNAIRSLIDLLESGLDTIWKNTEPFVVNIDVKNDVYEALSDAKLFWDWFQWMESLEQSNVSSLKIVTRKHTANGCCKNA